MQLLLNSINTQNITSELNKITKFLGLNDPKYNREECLRDDIDGGYKRSAITFKSIDMFDDEVGEKLIASIRKVSDVLNWYGYNDCTEKFLF